MKPPVLTTASLQIGYTPPRRPPVVVAQEIDVTLHSGQLTCLIGPNGAGKSTLLRTIAGMQPPLAGQVRLMGDDVRALSPSQLALRLSVVLTERPAAGLMTGYALVALGRHPHTGWHGRISAHDEAVVREAVAAVGATAIAHKPVAEMSDGQRQKIMIARALAQEPDLMLLDEPTAYLDFPRRVEVMRLLQQITQQGKRAILLSTHDLDLALRTADRIWLLADGKLTAGTPEDLVLSGAFELAFHSTGASFDMERGAFRIEHGTRGVVQVRGAGITRTWTLRALERAGYTITDEQTPNGVIIEVSPGCWQVTGGDHPRTCTSIEETLAVVSKLLPAH